MYNFWFQGQLPTNVVQSFTRREDSGLRSSPASIKDIPEIQSWSPKPGQSGDISAHEAESPSTVDLELTKSTSTGEVPSPVTFRLVPGLAQCVQQWLSHVHSVYSSSLIPMLLLTFCRMQKAYKEIHFSMQQSLRRSQHLKKYCILL